MKRKKIRVAAWILTVILMITGCSGKTDSKPDTINAAGMVNALLQEVKFDTNISSAGEKASLYFPGLPDGSSVELYSGSGYFADEVCLISLPDADKVQDAKPIVDKHIAELRNQFMNYVPGELNKIDHAVVHIADKYIFICISNDYENAAALLDSGKTAEKIQVDDTTAGSEHPDETAGTDSTAVETTIPVIATEPDVVEYPKLQSESGTYHKYDTLVIRVDDKAYEMFGYDAASAQAYADLVNRVADGLNGNTQVYALAIPTAIGVVLPDDIAAAMSGYEDQGKVSADVYSRMNDLVKPVHCFDNMMQHRDEYLYFHTDYHWNGRGAYYAYEAFCRTKGIQPYTLDEREEKRFDGFIGALYSQCSGNDPILKNNPDTVYAYLPKSKSASMKFTDSHGTTYDWSIVTDVSAWDAGTKYNAFAAGDNPLTVFTNPEVTDGSVAIVVKESYGNALMPYLVDHYSKIYEIDYRYWDGDLVSYAQEVGADDLIFANNLTMISSSFLIGKLANIIN